jgi:hypothetical protein
VTIPNISLIFERRETILGYPVYGVGATGSPGSTGTLFTPGTSFAFAIVLFVLLIIAGLGLFYLLRTLVWTNS